jgi:hypothetical protein
MRRVCFSPVLGFHTACDCIGLFIITLHPPSKMKNRSAQSMSILCDVEKSGRFKVFLEFNIFSCNTDHLLESILIWGLDIDMKGTLHQEENPNSS